ncbi:iron ABC transporter permease [Rhodococcus pyridinivorans]|uniref:FecCD family ABC transporter permease n=1 Tax=Rhodococcus pyridinivorans TaxID=103816 RepID=UPI0022273A04|nr:iron ABC transporter permease [Rhodococcus pyridinivorans]MCW3471577.1 iron ABC transporter permease [Rhodococcus pyridinivorans]
MTTAATTPERSADGPASAAGAPVVRSGLLSGNRTRLLGLAVATAVLVAVTLGSVLLGTLPVGLSDVVGAVTGSADSDVERVVRYIRIPRTVTGLLAGMALGLAGVVMQGLTRNPLAGPGLLGINAGAALAVVSAMVGLGITSAAGYVWFAFAGAAVAAVFVYMLGSLGPGGATPVKLALAGSALTALLGAVTTMITLQDASTMEDFRYWVVGSLTRSDSDALAAVAPFIAVGVVLAVGLTRALNALALGEDLARSLGARVWVDRIAGALAVVLLAGGATAIAGPVGFIGLVVPHIARMITGSDYRWVLAWTIVLAPMLLLIADIVGRLLVQPEQLQVGIITGLVGAPFFLYLVRNRKVVGT